MATAELIVIEFALTTFASMKGEPPPFLMFARLFT